MENPLEPNGLTVTRLLTDHDDERGRGGTTVTRGSKEFDEVDDVVALLPGAIGLNL